MRGEKRDIQRETEIASGRSKISGFAAVETLCNGGSEFRPRPPNQD
jgi:hypothetical protein